MGTGENAPMEAMAPPWRIPRRFWDMIQKMVRGLGEGKDEGWEEGRTVCSFWMSREKVTVPGRAEVIVSCSGLLVRVVLD